MKTPGECLFRAILYTLGGVLGWGATVHNGAQAAEPLCALVCTVFAVLWWRRYHHTK